MSYYLTSGRFVGDWPNLVSQGRLVEVQAAAAAL